MEIREEYEKLKKEIEKHNYLYYEKNESIISDTEFDFLLKRLQEMENAYPYLKEINSPTEKVGGFINDKFTKVRHTTPMLSLANTYNIEDIKDFDNRIKKILKSNENIEYVLELKLDGISIDLKYEKGILKEALTRGDGEFGEDVTENVYQIDNIPKKLEKEIDIHLRGEIVLPISEFNKINEIRMENGEDVFANPRNAASGTIRQIDKEIVKQRNLKCYLYFVINTNDFNLKTHMESINLIKELKLPTTNVFEIHTNFENLQQAINKWDVERKKLNFETDGLVLKVNDLSLYDTLGLTAKSPRWAIAYKFKPDVAMTKLKKISYQVGRTGVITPVANLEAVNLSGSIVKRASLHNFSEIKRKDIRENDYVLIQKAAEIIPQVIKPIVEKRTGIEKIIDIPEKCPFCESEVLTSDEIVAVKCSNRYCPEKLTREIEYFVSRDCMNIKGLGEKITRKLINLGFITNILDLYNLKNFKSELVTLDKMGEKNINNLIESIENSINNEYYRVIYSLGIPFVGKNASMLICDVFDDIEKLKNAKYEELLEIKGIGEKAAFSMIEYLKDENNIRIINSLKEIGFNLKAQKKEINDILNGQTFLATGSFVTLKREDIKDLVKQNGGVYLSAVSKNLNYLIVGEKAGSKLKKANDLNIKTISENEFLDMLKEGK